MIDYSLILTVNYPGTQWTLVGDSYEGLTWLDETAKPTQVELDSQWQAILNQKEANKYKQLRAAEYPAITDQLDTIFHGGLDAWKEQIQAVKDKYPKA